MSPEFFTDGCTGFFQSWRGIDLTGCCREHDFAWWSNPGDWIAWVMSIVALGLWFYRMGVWELVVPAVLVVSTIGAVLFARKPKDRANG